LNKSRRERLNAALVKLQQVEQSIDRIKDEEQDCMDNMPENLQSSDRYRAMENAVDHLEDAIESIQEAAGYVDLAINER